MTTKHTPGMTDPSFPFSMANTDLGHSVVMSDGASARDLWAMVIAHAVLLSSEAPSRAHEQSLYERAYYAADKAMAARSKT